jgi:hypothetical protein
MSINEILACKIFSIAYKGRSVHILDESKYFNYPKGVLFILPALITAS